MVSVQVTQLSKQYDSGGFKLLPFAVWPLTLSLLGQFSSSDTKSNGRICNQRSWAGA